jgi:hypothetical protein
MLTNIAGQTLLQISLIGAILIFPCGLKPHSQHHYTVLYNVFILCQMFNLINARAASKGDDPTVGMMDTPLYFGIMIGIGLVQIGLVQLAGKFFSCTPLSGKEWAVTIALGALTLPVGFMIRRLPGDRGEARHGSIRDDNERLLN